MVFVTDQVLNTFCKNEAMLVHFLPIWFGDVIDTGYGKFSRRGFFLFHQLMMMKTKQEEEEERDEEASSSYIIISHNTTELIIT